MKDRATKIKDNYLKIGFKDCSQVECGSYIAKILEDDYKAINYTINAIKEYIDSKERTGVITVGDNILITASDILKKRIDL